MENEIKNSIIDKSVKEISNICESYIKKGQSLFKAIDFALKEYRLEEEIILKYEFEMIKRGTKDNLELTTDQVNKIKNEIEKLIYDKYLEKIS
ncbi:MAG: hypothetical protein ACFFDY_04300 [Candidatus Thorarchaeota archaeon]